AIDEITGGRGVDFAIDGVGVEGTLEQCFRATRMGGTTVAVGVMHATIASTIDTFSLLMEKTLTGTYGGSLSPKRDIPAFVDLFMAGRLDIGSIVDRQFKLDDVPTALDEREQAKDVWADVVVPNLVDPDNYNYVVEFRAVDIDGAVCQLKATKGVVED